MLHKNSLNLLQNRSNYASKIPLHTVPPYIYLVPHKSLYICVGKRTFLSLLKVDFLECGFFWDFFGFFKIGLGICEKKMRFNIK